MKPGRIILIIILLLIVVFFLLSLNKKKNNSNRPEEKFTKARVLNTSVPIIVDTHCLEIVKHSHYTLCYNENTEQANWVAYKLFPQLMFKNAERKNRFKQDPYVSTSSAHSSDYKYSGYDRGHLLPSADLRFDQDANNSTFYMSNISPQLPQFNRGIWKKLEERVRAVAITSDSCYIITGPIHYIVDDFEIANGVDIPDAFYKSILVFNNDNIYAVSYLLPHSSEIKDYNQFNVSTDSIENLLNVNFFPLLDTLLLENIENDRISLNIFH